MTRAAMRSRLRSREISTRKQVGDAESMVIENDYNTRPDGGKEL